MLIPLHSPLVDVSHHLILHHELHKLPLVTLQNPNKSAHPTPETISHTRASAVVRIVEGETYHSSVADVDLPEVSRKVGLIADPEFARNSEGVGPPKARRSSRWRRVRGGSGAEREAAASNELEVSRGAPAGCGDGGGGGEGGGDGDHWINADCW